MTFVVYMVFKAGIGMNPAKVAAILEWPTPKFVKDVQSFLGFANFYKKFILHYSLTTPLTSLTRKGVKFTWSQESEAAFKTFVIGICSDVGCNKNNKKSGNSGCKRCSSAR